MSYPGNQITARPGEQRRHWPEEHPSGPIGPFGPIREGIDDDAVDEFSAAIYGDYALPSRHGRDGSQHGRGQDVPAPRNGNGYTASAGPRPASPQPARPPSALPRRTAPYNGPAPRTPAVPRQRRGRHAGGGYDTDQAAGPEVARQSPGNGATRRTHANQGARQEPRPQGTSDSGVAAPPVRGSRAQRGPANGYPPLPGEPGPRYPQGQFSAWNEPAPPAATPIEQLMASAPTWADAGDAGSVPPGQGPGGGVALAERPGGLRQHTGDIGQYTDDLAGYSDEEVEDLAADFLDVTEHAVEEPVITGVDEAAGPRTATQVATLAGPEVGTAAGRSRAAAAKERKAVRRKGRKRRRVVVAGICTPALVAVAAMAYVTHGGHSQPKNTPARSSSAATSSAAVPASSPSQSLGQWQHISTRADDPAPLALSQLFPAQFTAGGSFARTVEAGSSDCTSALFGSALQSAVRKHGCSQVMRASYLSETQKLMGTIGVLNLTNSAAASAVGKATGSTEFIAQLAAKSGPTHSLTKGTGLEEAEVKGHYLILTWVEFTNRHAPSTSTQKARLKTFSANLISQTANVSLTSRMVTGEPQVP
jgi:hypothetical protein